MNHQRAKIQSKALASRLNGLSAFGFGANWVAPEPETKVVRDFLTVLEDRRALYSQAVWEEPAHVIQSILRIREELTDSLKRVADKSPAWIACRIMRAACRDFLTLNSTQRLQAHQGMMRDGRYQDEEFFVGLGKLRAVFGQQIATLAVLYGVDVEAQLGSILPPAPE
jgi:hypothetical protein